MRLGLASLTLMLRPSTSLPFSAWMAARACSSSLISTNPKPLDRLVLRSMITSAESTEPNSLKSERSSSESVE